MSLLSSLANHDKDPGAHWASYSSPSVNNTSPNGLEFNPENDDVCLISTQQESPNSTRAGIRRLYRNSRKRNAVEKVCLEIDDDKKPMPRSSSDKSPKDFHVKGNDYIIPKLKTDTSNSKTSTLGRWHNSKNKEQHPTTDSDKEMSNARARNAKDSVQKQKPIAIKRSWKYTSSPRTPVRSSPRNAVSRTVSMTSFNDLQELQGSPRTPTSASCCPKSNKTMNDSLENSDGILETEDDAFTETAIPSSRAVEKEAIFCFRCNGPMTNTGCVKCVKESTNREPNAISVSSFYQSKITNKYTITYSAKKAENKKSNSKKRCLSRNKTESTKTQPRIDKAVNGTLMNNRTGTKRKSITHVTKSPELVHISSDEDDKDEQVGSDVGTMEEESTKEFLEDSVENQIMDETTQEYSDSEELEAASEEKCSIPKEDNVKPMVRDKDISMVRGKDVSMVSHLDIPMVSGKDVSMVSHLDIPMARGKDVSMISDKDISMVSHKDVSVVRGKDISMVRSKDVSMVRSKDISMVSGKDISMGSNTTETSTSKEMIGKSSMEDELDSYQRDSIETLLHVQHIYVGILHGKPTEPVKVTAEKIHISIANGKTVYNFQMGGSDLTSFMINNESAPLMVMIEPTPCWARKISEKYQKIKTFIDPGSPVYEKRQIVLLLCEKLAKPNLSDLMELVGERLSQLSVWKTMSPESAETKFKRLPRPSDDYSEDDSRLSSLITHRKSYHTRSKDITTIRDPKRPPQKLLVYPPSCKYGAITITTEDVECLQPGTYLNDVIIDFFMKYLFEEVLTASDKERTHIFSSFFYKRLTQKNRPSADQEPRTAEYMHKLVKTWTKNVDIFTKDFLIFPINESSHWYLTVICYPGLVAEQKLDESREDEDGVWVEGMDMHQGRDSVTRNNSMMSEDDGDDETFALPCSKKSKRMKTTLNKEPATRPCILIFDSLGGCHRSTVLINLRNYLSCEWKERKENDKPLTFNKLNLKGCYPKVPGQHNFSDCGVYVLQYVQSFFENPITDYKPPINLPDWFPIEVVDKKREFVTDLIFKLKDRIDIEDTS